MPTSLVFPAALIGGLGLVPAIHAHFRGVYSQVGAPPAPWPLLLLGTVVVASGTAVVTRVVTLPQSDVPDLVVYAAWGWIGGAFTASGLVFWWLARR